jgi:hypothetical protein
MTVFITGPGRSGTTFLIQLFTRLGYNTGLEPYNEGYEAECRAGCEVGPETEIEGTPDEIRQAFISAPHIIKGPVWAYLLKYFVKNDLVEVEHVFMPLRDLTVATYSRLSVGLDFLLDKDFIETPGAHVEERQENILALLVGKVVEVCYLYDVPLTLMRFPQLVEDADYCFRKVTEFDEINRKRFDAEFERLAQPSQIKWGLPEKVRAPA